MDSLNRHILEYKKQIEKGDIVKAYRGIMAFIMELRTYFEGKFQGYIVSGSIYYGYMDMTYFSITPPGLRTRKLKIALVFLHDRVRWEAWLAANNRQIQKEYIELFKHKGWNKYPVSALEKGVDSIVECTLVDNPDFDNPAGLRSLIEVRLLAFIKEVEDFLKSNPRVN